LGRFADLDAAIAEALLEAITWNAKAMTESGGYDTIATKRNVKDEAKQLQNHASHCVEGGWLLPQGGEVEGFGWWA
jgi:hypothetical protein